MTAPGGGQTQSDPSGWSVDTLHEYMQAQLSDLGKLVDARLTDLMMLLNERYQTQTKAVDAAFLAQQTAMQTALTAAERAVATALLSAEKAVNKAEVAAEKRFEAVNEFRAQLSDQANTFIPRAESEARLGAIVEKQSSLEHRVDKAEGLVSGKNATWSMVVAAIGAVGVMVSIVAAIIIIVSR